VGREQGRINRLSTKNQVFLYLIKRENRYSVRRILIAIATATTCPYQDLLAIAAQRVQIFRNHE
jgi:hypothetical protein